MAYDGSWPISDRLIAAAAGVGSNHLPKTSGSGTPSSWPTKVVALVDEQF
jgi:hypothetical protein